MALGTDRRGREAREPQQGCGTGFNAIHWLNIEPCGLFCASLSWFIVLYCMYAMTFHVITPWLGASAWGLVHVTIFDGAAILALCSHYKAMTTNPGAVPREAQPLHPANQRRCRRCHVFKPPRAHHCSLCGRCIVKMDHHCPWVNNCVGIGNHKFFILFCGYVFFISAYAVLVMFLRYTTCLGEPKGCMLTSGPTAVAHYIGVLVCAMLFGLFTMCMVCEQVTSIATGQTAIDRLKGGDPNAGQKTMVENLAEVFGGKGPSVHWVLPTRVWFPDPDITFGYITEPDSAPLMGSNV